MSYAIFVMKVTKLIKTAKIWINPYISGPSLAYKHTISLSCQITVFSSTDSSFMIQAFTTSSFRFIDLLWFQPPSDTDAWETIRFCHFCHYWFIFSVSNCRLCIMTYSLILLFSARLSFICLVLQFWKTACVTCHVHCNGFEWPTFLQMHKLYKVKRAHSADMIT